MLGGLLAEVAVMAVFLMLLGLFRLAGLPELAAPMTPLDYADALVSSFVSIFLFTLWVARPLESGFIVHGLLVALVATSLFLVMWGTTAGPVAQQPILYWVAHALKFAGGIAGGTGATRSTHSRRQPLVARTTASKRRSGEGLMRLATSSAIAKGLVIGPVAVLPSSRHCGGSHFWWSNWTPVFAGPTNTRVVWEAGLHMCISLQPVRSRPSSNMPYTGAIEG